MSGDNSNHWGLESFASFLTHTFGIWAEMTQKLVSAETVDWSIRKLLHGALASSQYGSLRVVKVFKW